MTVLDLPEADATESSVTTAAAPPVVTTVPVTPLTWLKSTLMSILLRVVRGFGQYPWLVAPLVCCLPLALHLTGSDTPAEAYRVWLFHHFGFTIWNTQWYGGHTVLGYSVLFPPLAGFLGSGTVGLGACTLTAFWATLLIRRETGRQHRLALLAFSAAVVENLVVGRMAFAVGLAFAVLALLQVSLQAAAPGAAFGDSHVAGQPACRFLPGARRDRVAAHQAAARRCCRSAAR